MDGLHFYEGNTRTAAIRTFLNRSSKLHGYKIYKKVLVLWPLLLGSASAAAEGAPEAEPGKEKLPLPTEVTWSFHSIYMFKTNIEKGEK